MQRLRRKLFYETQCLLTTYSFWFLILSPRVILAVIIKVPSGQVVSQPPSRSCSCAGTPVLVPVLSFVTSSCHSHSFGLQRWWRLTQFLSVSVEDF